MKIVSTGSFHLGVEFNFKRAWGEDVDGWWGLVLEDQSCFIGLCDNPGESIKVLKKSLIGGSQSQLHFLLFNSWGREVEVCFENHTFVGRGENEFFEHRLFREVFLV
jgi:hypothetical protein